MRKITLTFAILSLLMVGIISNTYGQTTFPPAGTDSFLTTAEVTVEIPDGDDEVLMMTGPAVVVRGDPAEGEDGRSTIPTEMVALILRGTSAELGPIVLRAGAQFGLEPSMGEVVELVKGTTFPAESFFDVFAEVDIPAMNLPGQFRNPRPALIESVIDRLPPLGRVYKKVSPTEFVLLDANGGEVAKLVLKRVVHRPIEDPPVPQKRSVRKLTTTWAGLKKNL